MTRLNVGGNPDTQRKLPVITPNEECGRATLVGNSDAMGRPQRSVLSLDLT